MTDFGMLRVRVFLSKAQLPVPDSTVAVYSATPGKKKHLIALRITDESGIAGPFCLYAGSSLGLTPEQPLPFSDYQLLVEHPDYQIALFENLQVFPGTETIQDVALIPLSGIGTPDSSTTTVTPQPL